MNMFSNPGPPLQSQRDKRFKLTHIQWQPVRGNIQNTLLPHPLSGLSLMETLLVLAMLAVIMAWAVPQYQDHLRRGQRQLAKLSLMQTAQWLERAAATQGTYPNPSQVPPALLQVPGGAYQIQLQTDAAANTFALQAVPQASQTSDACGMLTLNHLGEQGVQYASLSAQSCWGR